MINHVAQVKYGIQLQCVEGADGAVDFWKGEGVQADLIMRTIAVLTIREDPNPQGFGHLSKSPEREKQTDQRKCKKPE
jgi:hypothetical protein